VVDVSGVCGSSEKYGGSHTIFSVPLELCWRGKIESLNFVLKKWNEEIFGNVGKRKKELVDGI
jgi:hypothetical protein